jgi:hypothetical protein
MTVTAVKDQITAVRERPFYATSYDSTGATDSCCLKFKECGSLLNR